MAYIMLPILNAFKKVAYFKDFYYFLTSWARFCPIWKPPTPAVWATRLIICHEFFENNIQYSETLQKNTPMLND